MSKSAPHQDLMSTNGITAAELPAKTQRLIEKFAAETDEDRKETLDEKIFSDVDDFIEAKAKAAKAEEKKGKREEVKKKIDVSTAATATGNQTATTATDPVKAKSFMGRVLGRKD
jgi:TRAP-type C4-dicarboxylate transport system substrate-binding protein